jgi:inner membrane protein
MYAPGHVGLAVSLYAPVGWLLLARGRRRLALGGGLCAACLSTLPDVDQFVPFLAHRGLTHTVWVAAAVGLVVGALGVGYGRRRARETGPVDRLAVGVAVGALPILAHLLGDVITPMGVRPFAPLWNASFTLDLVPARDVTANRGLFAVGGLATHASWWLGSRYSLGDGGPSESGRDPRGDRGPAGEHVAGDDNDAVDLPDAREVVREDAPRGD